MTKITSIAAAVATILVLAACNNANYKKTPSGIMYKIVKSGSGPELKTGQFIKFNYTQLLRRASYTNIKDRDSVFSTSQSFLPGYARVDSVGGYQPSEVFRLLHKGDSVEILQLVDSLMVKYPMGMPPFLKKGDKLILKIRVEDVFTADSLVKADYEREMKKFNDQSVAAIESKLKSKNLTAQKAGEGTYVVIKTPGDGPQIDSGKYVSMRYSGKFFDTDKEFESNMQPDKEPFGFVIGQHQVIPGWDEGIRLLKKGSKATLYIPGFLAYGMQAGPGGKPLESLVFDVEVVDVADKAPAPKPQPPVQMPIDTAMPKK